MAIAVHIVGIHFRATVPRTERDIVQFPTATRGVRGWLFEPSLRVNHVHQSRENKLITKLSLSEGRDFIVWFPGDVSRCLLRKHYVVSAGGTTTIKRNVLGP